jgi:hypothetical protein
LPPHRKDPMAQEFATLYLHLPCELVDVLRGWSDDPKRLSRVVQYLIVGEQARARRTAADPGADGAPDRGRAP